MSSRKKHEVKRSQGFSEVGSLDLGQKIVSISIGREE